MFIKAKTDDGHTIIFDPSQSVLVKGKEKAMLCNNMYNTFLKDAKQIKSADVLKFINGTD